MAEVDQVNKEVLSSEFRRTTLTNPPYLLIFS